MLNEEVYFVNTCSGIQRTASRVDIGCPVFGGPAAVSPVPFASLGTAFNLTPEQDSCLSSVANCEHKNEIYDYLNANILPDGSGWEQEALGFAGLVLDELFDDCEWGFEDAVINNLQNPCAKNIFTEIEDGIYEEDELSPEVSFVSESIDLNFSESILVLFNQPDRPSYEINNGSLSNTSANAETVPSSSVIVTTIADNYLTNATELSIARTIIHELVHAYLIARNSELDFAIAMQLYATENGININDPNAFQHEFMKKYMEAMAYSLRQWDIEYGTGGNLGWDYYYSMAFSGQFAVDQNGNITSVSDTFMELVPIESDRQQTVNIILNEQNGTNAQGSDCN